MIEVTEKKIADTKERFITELRNTGRKGVDNLISAMEQGGFFEAPCSGQHHLAEEGGLLQHSLNVFDYAKKLNAAFDYPCPDDAVAISALLHDLGKMGDHGKPNYVENILKGGTRSAAKPFVTNSNLIYLPHSVRSVAISERYITLTEEEETAIYWHDGLYGTFKYDIPGKEIPLYMIIHYADLWVSRVTEVEEEE